jgi:hypothetical protein
MHPQKITSALHKSIQHRQKITSAPAKTNSALTKDYFSTRKRLLEHLQKITAPASATPSRCWIAWRTLHLLCFVMYILLQQVITYVGQCAGYHALHMAQHATTSVTGASTVCTQRTMYYCVADYACPAGPMLDGKVGAKHF